MSPPRSLHALLIAWSLVACAPAPHVDSPLRAAPTPSASGVTRASASAAAPPAPPAPPAPTSPSVANATPTRPCGALNCLAFADAGAAFDYVLASNPRVLAIGEAHAQDSTPGIPSSTRRFAEQLLPKLAGKSKHIVIELLLANCRQQTVESVKKQQAPVIEHQAKTNQNEFVALGKVAERLGIQPQGLTPECPEYEAVVKAGEDGVARLLTLVADQTVKEVEALLATPDSQNDLILSYGGALHNDLDPRPEQKAWSFGPRLAAATQNHYVELDLIVPELVKDSEAWRNLPWYGAFDREHLTNEAILFRPVPNSFVLIFPKTEHTQAQ